MNTPTVTIAIPTFNRPEQLRQAVLGAVHQSATPDEVLIVDDGSSDGVTRGLCESMAGNYRGVRVVHSEHRGRPAIRNRAFDECKTSHLMWIDDDDVLLPTAVENQLRAFSRNKDADVVYGNVMRCDKSLRPIKLISGNKLPANAPWRGFFKGNPVPNPAALVSLECYKKVGTYQQRFRCAEDYDFFARAASAGARFAYNNNTVALCRSPEHGPVASSIRPENAQYDSWVVQDLVSNHMIEELFPDEPWQTNPNLSLTRAALQISERLCGCGAARDAADLLESLQPEGFEQEVSFAATTTRRTAEDGLDGLLSLRREPLFLSPTFEGLVNAISKFYGTPVQHDAFQAQRLRQRLTSTPIQKLFPNLPWSSESSKALAAAFLEATRLFIVFGDFGGAASTMNQACTEEMKPVVAFVESMLLRFQKGGLGGVMELRNDPLFHDPFSSTIFSALIQRAERLAEIAEIQRQ